MKRIILLAFVCMFSCSTAHAFMMKISDGSYSYNGETNDLSGVLIEFNIPLENETWLLPDIHDYLWVFHVYDIYLSVADVDYHGIVDIIPSEDYSLLWSSEPYITENRLAYIEQGVLQYSSEVFYDNNNPPDGYSEFPALASGIKITGLSIDLIFIDYDEYGNISGRGEVNFSALPVPEPCTILLFGTGLICLLGKRKFSKSTRA